jgi:hypothetical protein
MRSRQSLSYSRISQNYMELKYSLPCSQDPSTGPYPKPDWSISFYFSSIHLILSSHLRLGHPSGLFSSGFPIKTLHTFLFSSIRVWLHPLVIYHHSLSHSNYVWRRVQVMKLLVMRFSGTSYYSIHFSSRYSPQQPVSKYLQSAFSL